MTPISNIGEFQLIERLTKGFSQTGANILKAIGDDAAVVKSANGLAEVFSTDLLLEGVHFDLSYMPLRHLGYKALAVNLSDIFAMNAIPYGVTVSIAMSNRFTVEALEELYEGIEAACKKWNITLLGGDTSSSKQGLIISVTAFGRAKEDEIVYRSGAKANELICVTGDLGGAYGGFLVLDREKNVFLETPEAQPDLSDYDYVIGRQLKPEARGDVIQKLRELKIQPTSLIDISDSLASELHHICKQSKTGAHIYANKLPIDWQTVKVAEEFKINPTTFGMNGGEDYELLFTVPLSAYEKLKSESEIHIIGKMTEDVGQLDISLEGGQMVKIEAQGWEHFSGE